MVLFKLLTSEALVPVSELKSSSKLNSAQLLTRRFITMYFTVGDAERLTQIMTEVGAAYRALSSNVDAVFESKETVDYIDRFNERRFGDLPVEQVAQDGEGFCVVLDQLNTLSFAATEMFRGYMDELLDIVARGSMSSNAGNPVCLKDGLLETMKRSEFGDDISLLAIFKLPYIKTVKYNIELLSIGLNAFLVFVFDAENIGQGIFRPDADIKRALPLFENLYGMTKVYLHNIAHYCSEFGDDDINGMVDLKFLLSFPKVLRNFLIAASLMLEHPGCSYDKARKADLAADMWEFFKRELLEDDGSPTFYLDVFKIFRRAIDCDLELNGASQPFSQYKFYDDFLMLSGMYPYPHPACGYLYLIESDYVHSLARDNKSESLEDSIARSKVFGRSDYLASRVMALNDHLVRSSLTKVDASPNIKVEASVSEAGVAEGLGEDEAVDTDGLEGAVADVPELADVPESADVAVAAKDVLMALPSDALVGAMSLRLMTCEPRLFYSLGLTTRDVISSSSKKVLPIKLDFAVRFIEDVQQMRGFCMDFQRYLFAGGLDDRYLGLIKNMVQNFVNCMQIFMKSLQLMNQVWPRGYSMSKPTEKKAFVEVKLKMLDAILQFIASTEHLFSLVRSGLVMTSATPKPITVSLDNPVEVMAYFRSQRECYSANKDHNLKMLGELACAESESAEQMARFEALLAEETRLYEENQKELERQQRIVKDREEAQVLAAQKYLDEQRRQAELASGYHDAAVVLPAAAPPVFVPLVPAQEFNVHLGAARGYIVGCGELKRRRDYMEANVQLEMASFALSAAYQLVVMQNMFNQSSSQGVSERRDVAHWMPVQELISKESECEMYLCMLDVERLRSNWTHINPHTYFSLSLSAQHLAQLVHHVELIPKDSPILGLIRRNIEMISQDLDAAERLFESKVAAYKKELVDSKKSSREFYTRTGYKHKDVPLEHQSRFSQRRDLLNTFLIPQAERNLAAAQNAKQQINFLHKTVALPKKPGSKSSRGRGRRHNYERR